LGITFEKQKDSPLGSSEFSTAVATEKKVRSLAHFIATVNPEIPYSLLAFYPLYMSDLPFLQRSTAEKCLQAAREEGVRNVRLGNMQLLR
jgi:pyruvate formate lyase activating enzyme